MNTTTHFSSAARRGGLLVLAVLALAVGATACSADQKRGLGEVDARDALSGQVEQVVTDQGSDVDGDLSCTATIGSDGAVTSTCTGTTTSGAAVTGTFTGTADIDAETCTAQLDVEIDGATVADEPDVDCFDVG
jgi:hypothetical protein